MCIICDIPAVTLYVHRLINANGQHVFVRRLPLFAHGFIYGVIGLRTKYCIPAEYINVLRLGGSRYWMNCTERKVFYP